jgi:GTPase Era involved in 16S rRNA processing
MKDFREYYTEAKKKLTAEQIYEKIKEEMKKDPSFTSEEYFVDSKTEIINIELLRKVLKLAKEELDFQMSVIQDLEGFERDHVQNTMRDNDFPVADDY